MARHVATPEQQLDQIRELVAEQRALTKTQMAKVHSVLPLIRHQLELDGLEIASVIRVPLRTQLMRLLGATVSGLSFEVIAAHVAGATDKELKLIMTELVGSGDVIEVLSLAGVAYCHAQCAALDCELLDEQAQSLMLHQMQQQIAVLKKASKSSLGDALPRPYVRLALAASGLVSSTQVADVNNADTASTQMPTDDIAELILKLVAALLGQRGPVRIPDLLPHFGVTTQTAQAALLTGARAGYFDLQPESGMARLSTEDAKWCPPGPGQTLLAWLMPKTTR